jgi:hypothetical protein
MRPTASLPLAVFSSWFFPEVQQRGYTSALI